MRNWWGWNSFTDGGSIGPNGWAWILSLARGKLFCLFVLLSSSLNWGNDNHRTAVKRWFVEIKGGM